MASEMASPTLESPQPALSDEILHGAVGMAARPRPLSWRLWLLATIAFLIAGGYVLDHRLLSVAKVSVPYGQQSVISTTSSGMAMSPFDFETTKAFASATASATTTPTARPQPPSRPASSRRRGAGLRASADEPTEVLVGMKEVAAALAAPSAAPRPVVMNVGTRFEARFLTPVLTGAATGIASAETTADLTVADGRVVAPKGSRLEGDAIAVQESDRAQVAFKALVIGGKTVPIRGLVIGADGQLGVPGKVLRKGSSKGKGFAGRLLGAAANVAGTAGSLVGLSFPEEVAGQLAQSATGDVKALSASWRRSDKVVEVSSGVVVQVYLGSDVEIK